MGKCTLLMVAHKLNTLQRANFIYRIGGKRAVPCDRAGPPGSAPRFPPTQPTNRTPRR